jgi:site-specific DNA-cytosine methylase
MSKRRKLTAIGLTCGVGSMLIGARDSGCKVLGNIEWRKYYSKPDSEGRTTFTENFPGALFAQKIDDLSESEIETLTGADIAFSHPECGNFSQLRVNKHAALNDPGDIPIAVELIKRLKPKFFVLDELPKSLIAYPMSKWSEELLDYDLFPEWISNYNYGNVQKNRRRMFMLGALKTERFSFVPGEEENELTIADVIGDLKGREGEVPNHQQHISGKTKCGKAKNLYAIGVQYTWADARKYFRGVNEGTVMKYHSPDGSMKNRMGFYKENWEGTGHVLDGGSPLVHPKTCLPLSIRERARIQGAPDDFVFYGTVLEKNGKWNFDKNMHMVKQTGKFMPVHFCRYVAKQIVAHIRGKVWKSSGERLIAENTYVNSAKFWYCENVGYAHQEGACGNCWLLRRCTLDRRTSPIPLDFTFPSEEETPPWKDPKRASKPRRKKPAPDRRAVPKKGYFKIISNKGE